MTATARSRDETGSELDAGSSGPVPPALLLRNISKRFGPVQANDDITVEVRPGEIHALLGENGSGKSTLLSIASGSQAPDDGTVIIDGRPLTSASPRLAMQLGLGMAYQHLTSVAGLTVAESLFLAAPDDDRRPRYSQMYRWADEQLAEYGLEIHPTARIETLSAAEQQLLEVVSALLSRPSVLLLDEPTTALGHADVQRLHALIRRLAENGMAIVYVSHRLPEVLDVAHRVTVLRDGEGQGTYDAAGMSESDVVAMMIGRPLEQAFPTSTPSDAHEIALDVIKFRGRRFGPVNLQLRQGEIVGIAGAEGNGQVEFLRALAGVEPSHGTVECSGHRVNHGTPAGAIRAGIILLSADRKQESIFTALSVRANATLQVLRKYSTLGFVLRSREKAPVDRMVDRLRLKAASNEQPTQYLSGGNQQKVALMRPFLRDDLKVILADEPTQGVDVGARLDIYNALRDKAAEGTAMLVKSSDAIELAGICDRVVVMSRGIVVDEIPHEELEERRIIAAIIGRGSAHGEDHGK